MNIIAIEGIEINAPIGIYPHEKANGCDFIVDVYITVDLKILEMNDNLAYTVDYEFVYNLVKSTMKKGFNLIESAIKEIYFGITSKYDNLKEVRIKIRKLNPLQENNLHSAFVEGIFPIK
jgi:dihydroneopterin aldolase